MDDFSVLSSPYIYVEATREKEWNSLHALKGIGKEGKTVTLSITYTQQSFLPFLLIISIAQLGQRQTQGQKFSASIPGHGIVLVLHVFIFSINSNTTTQKALPHYVFVTCGIRCNNNHVHTAYARKIKYVSGLEFFFDGTGFRTTNPWV